MYSIGIDPGFSNIGMVVWDGKRKEVLATYTYGGIKTPEQRKKLLTEVRPHDIGDRVFMDGILIAHYQTMRVMADIEKIIEQWGMPAVMGIESFVDQRNRAREEAQQKLKDRWKTPLMIGMLTSALYTYGIRDEDIIWGNAGIVINQQRDVIKALEDLKKNINSQQNANFLDQIIRNHSTLVNDHLRKAWAHADWSYNRIARIKENQTHD